MKRKVILALLATMTLTVGSLGTAFAMNSNQGIVIQTSESSVPTTPETPENPDQGETETPDEPEAHTHTWGDAYYVKDADAVYDQVKVIDQEEKWDWVINIISPAWDEEITEIHTVCFTCGCDFDAEGMSNEEVSAHAKAHVMNGESGDYGSREVVVDTIHHEAVTEKVWTKVQDEISHMENVLVTPEKGHWEHACADCGTVENCEKPGTVIPDDPDTNGNTDKPGDTTENTGGNTQTSGDNTGNTDEDTLKPGTSTGNNTQTTTDDKTQSGKENTSNTENKSEDQKQNENKETTTTDSKDQKQDDTTVTVSTEKKAPKTGDTSSLIYLATLAGSAVTGGTAFGLRRKFKK